MTTYVIGDIQGCFDQLMKLLEIINFNEQTDHLICAGDIINRGPKSLETIKFLANLPKCTVTIGNHDLHLLREYYIGNSINEKDTIDEIIQSNSSSTLCEWLRHQPVMYYDQNSKVIVCHAGIYPFWSIENAKIYAREFEDELQSDNVKIFLANMYPNSSTSWSEELEGIERYSFFKSSFTLMRYLTNKNQLDFSIKCNPKNADPKYIPWFNIANPALQDHKIIFGHWSSLNGNTNNEQFICLDTGCVWGNYLTAIRLSDLKKFAVKNNKLE